jgi:hypothetical protein
LKKTLAWNSQGPKLRATARRIPVPDHSASPVRFSPSLPEASDEDSQRGGWIGSGDEDE